MSIINLSFDTYLESRTREMVIQLRHVFNGTDGWVTSHLQLNSHKCIDILYVLYVTQPKRISYHQFSVNQP